MSDDYLPLDVLGEIVRAKTGIEVDTAALAGAPASVSELGIDSLGWLGVLADVENRYRVTLDGTAESITTLPDLVVLVNTALAGGARPGHSDNRVVIDAPLNLVWEMTNDVVSWPELFNEYAAAVILDRDGETVRFRLSTVPDEHCATYSWVSERTTDRARLLVTARRTEPGLFAHMDITWRYREVPGGVEMRWTQDFAMRPDAPVTDAQMTDYINRNSVLQMARIKGRVEAAARAGSVS